MGGTSSTGCLFFFHNSATTLAQDSLQLTTNFYFFLSLLSLISLFTKAYYDMESDYLEVVYLHQKNYLEVLYLRQKSYLEVLFGIPGVPIEIKTVKGGGLL